MAATGNMAVIAALMAGFAFAGLTAEIPDAASKSKTAGHFLMGTSVTTGLSLLLLFQQGRQQDAPDGDTHLICPASSVCGHRRAASQPLGRWVIALTKYIKPVSGMGMGRHLAH